MLVPSQKLLGLFSNKSFHLTRFRRLIASVKIRKRSSRVIALNASLKTCKKSLSYQSKANLRGSKRERRGIKGPRESRMQLGRTLRTSYLISLFNEMKSIKNLSIG